jgi:hypothetical protein
VLLCLGWVRGVWISGKCWKGNRTTSILMAACGFSLGGVMLHAMVDFPLQIASLQLTTLLVAAILWGCRDDLLVKTQRSCSCFDRSSQHKKQSDF